MAPIRMERIRNRPRSKVLLAHKKGSQTNGSRSPQLGAPLRCRRSGPTRPGEGVVTMRWLRRLFQKSRADDDLDRELHFHLERQIADHIAAGISAEEARRRANLEFGGLERVKEEVRDTRWETHLENFFLDLRYALRNARKSRGFTFIAALALALGIGTSSIVFSVVYNVFFDALPYKAFQRSVVLEMRNLQNVGGWKSRNYFFPEEVRAFRQQNQVFEDVIAYVGV